MHFKGLPWDFLHSDFVPRESGICGFYCSDFYLQKLLLGRMFSGKFSVLWGRDVSFDWFRDNIVNSSLFSTQGKYLIYDSEHIGTEVKQAILEHRDWEDKGILLCFSKKEGFFKELSKLSGAGCVHIEPPRFWEGEKLLKFLCEQMKVPMSHDAKSYFLDAVPFKIRDFIQTLKFLSLNVPQEGELSRKMVEELVEPKELNLFVLASFLSSKKFEEFYGRLVKKRVNYDTYRSVFSFMQTHLLKLGDTGYMEKKSRLSKYDREILTYSKCWSEDEIRMQLRGMGEWEIRAKMRDPFLVSRLRCHLLGFS